MSDTVIRVENLSKKYLLDHQQEGRSNYKSIRETWTNGINSIGKKILSPRSHQGFKPSQEEFWALKDVSFEIKQGDRVGIIGRNGAGKSTLLKVLSRITEPSNGKIGIKGRIASLLEVGTGFHPELTGRENIFLNGAILGMSQVEIKRKFDEIVDFAEVEKFLDTPVKRYSSGMYVRLAFAVAAHLEPEILIVDEVLAVGDAQFQKKCLGKMEAVGKEGRTVLFVSHTMSAIHALCHRGIVLQSGKVLLDGSTDEAIDTYLETGCAIAQEIPIAQRKDRSGSGKIKVVDIRIVDSRGVQVSSIQSGEDYCFEIDCCNQTDTKLSNVVLSLDIFDERDNIALLFRTNFTNEAISMAPGLNCIKCQIQDLPITLGMYRTSIFVSHADQEILDYVRDASSFSVEGGDFFGTGSSGLPSHCKILTKADWSWSMKYKAHVSSVKI
jgi:lipopolysaccharide transport system ATP-binding protein